MLDSRCLEALEAVIRLGSFERAAQSLGLTQSAISQRIKRLESQFGEPLLVRSKPVIATAAGDRVFQYILNAHLLERELRAEGKAAAHGFERVRLAVNADSLATWFAELPARLFHQHQLLVDLIVDDETRTLDILKSGHALASIGTRTDQVQGLTATRLGTLHYIPVATPAFVARFFPNGVNAQTLRFAPTVIYGRHDELLHLFLDKYYGVGPGEFPFHVLPSSEGFVVAACQGIGYTLCAEPQVQTLLETGQLVQISKHSITRPLVFHRRTREAEVLQIISREIRALAQKTLRPNAGRHT